MRLRIVAQWFGICGHRAHATSGHRVLKNRRSLPGGAERQDCRPESVVRHSPIGADERGESLPGAFVFRYETRVNGVRCVRQYCISDLRGFSFMSGVYRSRPEGRHAQSRVAENKHAVG